MIDSPSVTIVSQWTRSCKDKYNALVIQLDVKSITIEIFRSLMIEDSRIATAQIAVECSYF